MGQGIGDRFGCRAHAFSEIPERGNCADRDVEQAVRLPAIRFGGEQEVDGVGVHSNGLACRRVDAGDIGLLVVEVEQRVEVGACVGQTRRRGVVAVDAERAIGVEGEGRSGDRFCGGASVWLLCTRRASV